MFTYLKNIFTGCDNETYSMTKLITLWAFITISYNFIIMHSIDYQGYGIAAGIIAGILVGKTIAEKK